MMTSREILADIYGELKGSSLAEAVTGGVYYEGTRPRDSRQEDIVVIYTSGTTGDIQRGYVTLNIYVPDVAPRKGEGVFMENIARTAAIEAAAQQWVDSLTPTHRRIYLEDTISVEKEDEIHQHIVVAALRYEYCNY